MDPQAGSPSPDELLHAGENAFQQGDIAGAEQLFRAALERGPAREIARELNNNLGVLAHARGLAVEADAAFRAALGADPRYADAVRNLIELWRRQGDQSRASLWSERLAQIEALDPGGLPTVTCLMTAYNYERYVAEAIRSVLEQAYPPELLDLVVVDDGSTDGTAEVVRALQRAAPGRINLVQTENRGLAAATQTAIDTAQGRLLAICDADDRWLPDRVAHQVDVFRSDAEVTLVYGDMEIIDETGAVTERSFLRAQGLTVKRGNVIDELATVNFTSNSTLMWRAEIPPIPAESPYADYWVAAHAAAAGIVIGLDRPLAQYRQHTANMVFRQSSTEGLAKAAREELRIRRLILTGPAGDSVNTGTLVGLALAMDAKAREIYANSGRVLIELTPVSDAQRAEAHALTQSLSMSALTADEQRLRGLARAVLLDPYNGEARDMLDALLQRLRAAAPAR